MNRCHNCGQPADILGSPGEPWVWLCMKCLLTFLLPQFKKREEDSGVKKGMARKGDF